MIKTTLSDKVEIVCSPDTVFTEYSFAIEQGINWFFGRGVSAFKAERYFLYGVESAFGQDQCVKLTPLKPLQPMTFSLITSVGVLVKEGFWPKELTFEETWRVPGDRKEVKDGHHRVYRANREMTVIQSYGLDPRLSIGEIAYGLSDFITGFFWQGAKWVKFQGSLGLTQHQIDKGFDGDELARYISDPGPGYSTHQKVSTLPK